MKKITVRAGAKMIVRQILVEDLSKIYYFKKRCTPKLPKYVDLPS